MELILFHTFELKMLSRFKRKLHLVKFNYIYPSIRSILGFYLLNDYCDYCLGLCIINLVRIWFWFSVFILSIIYSHINHFKNVLFILFCYADWYYVGFTSLPLANVLTLRLKSLISRIFSKRFLYIVNYFENAVSYSKIDKLMIEQASSIQLFTI